MKSKVDEERKYIFTVLDKDTYFNVLQLKAKVKASTWIEFFKRILTIANILDDMKILDDVINKAIEVGEK